MGESSVIKPEIFYGVPYSSEKNLGKAYNDFASLIPEGAWLCLMDADILPTTPDYGSLIEQIIIEHPEVEAFTAMTNRVRCPWQLAPVDWDNDNIGYHRMVGAGLKATHGTRIEDMTQARVFSGFFLCIRKSLWSRIGGAKEAGMLGIDNNLHRRIRNAGAKLYLAKGLYFYHWYRGGDTNDTRHLI